MTLTQQEQRYVNLAKKNLFIVFIAMVISALTLLVVLQLISSQSHLNAEGSTRFLLVAFGTVAFSLVALAYFFRMFRLRKQLSQPLGGEKTGIVQKTLAVYTTGCVASFAMSEAIAGMGFVLYFIHGNRFSFFGFLGLSLATFFICKPSGQELDAYVRAQKEMAENSL